jgi:hypothetical protein
MKPQDRARRRCASFLGTSYGPGFGSVCKLQFHRLIIKFFYHEEHEEHEEKA